MQDEQNVKDDTMATQTPADTGTATRQGLTPLTWADVPAEDRAATWEGVIVPPYLGDEPLGDNDFEDGGGGDQTVHRTTGAVGEKEIQLLMEAWEAERRAKAAFARHLMFARLKPAGY